jgi:hypothetical protein
VSVPGTLGAVMHALKAHVRNGRLVLDEPTDLPEGEVVYLQPVEDDDLDNEERAALHAALRKGSDAIARGDVVDADVVINELLAR